VSYAIYTAGTGVSPLPRFGDISGISVDPVDSTVWGIAEYAVANANYATSIVHLASGLATGISVTAAPSSQTIIAGSNAMFTIGITGEASPATLSCSGLPANSTCNFAPGALNPGQISSTLIINTSATHASALRSWLFFVLLPLPMLFTISAPRRRWVLLLLAVSFLAIVVACGGGAGQSPVNVGGGTGGTPVGTYPITVTAVAGSFQGTTTITLTVQ
jgi:hypothetical protein